MSIAVGNLEIVEALEALLARPQEASRATDYTLFVGDDDWTDRAQSIEITGGDGPALLLTADMPGHLPDYMGQDVSLDVEVGGFIVRRFTGKGIAPERDGESNKLVANSAGFWNAEIEVGALVLYGGWAPDLVGYDVLQRNAYYIGSEIFVAPLTKPRFNTDRGQVFSRKAKLTDILGALQEHTPFEHYDTPMGGSHLLRPVNLAVPGEINANFEVGVHIDPSNGFGYTREPVNWRDVAAYMPRANPLPHQDPFIEMARAPIHDGHKTAPPGATYPIELQGGDSESQPTTDPEAEQMVYEAAEMLHGGRYDFDVLIRFIHPLLLRGDRLGFDESEQIEQVIRERRWVAHLTNYVERYPAREMQLQGKMLIAEERQTDYRQKARVAGLDAGGAVRVPIGVDYRGAYFTDALPFIERDGGVVLFNATKARQAGITSERVGNVLILREI